MVAVALALVLAVPLYAATIPVTLDAYSLSATYWPHISGSLEEAGAWNASFTESSWATYDRGTAGVGQGYYFGTHNSTLDPSYVRFDFYGTGIEFFGYWGYLGQGRTTGGGAGSISLYVEADGYAGPQNLIFSGRSTQRTMDTAHPVSLGLLKNLQAGLYTVYLRVTDGTISFTHAVLDVDFGATQPEMEVVQKHPINRSPVARNEMGELVRNDAFGNWSGTGWAVIPERVIMGTASHSDSVLIDLGTGNYWMNLKGGRGAYGFRYALSPSPVMLYNKSNERRTYTHWQVSNASLLATTLDPTVRYTLSLENLNSNGWDLGGQVLNEAATWFEIGSLELWSKNGVPLGSRGIPMGAIVGIAVGGVFVLIAKVSAIWWFVRGRRHCRRGALSPAEGFEIDGSPAVTTPFIYFPMMTDSPRSSYFRSFSSQSSQVPLVRNVHGKPVSLLPGRQLSTSPSLGQVAPRKLLQPRNRHLSSNRLSLDSSGTNLTQPYERMPSQPTGSGDSALGGQSTHTFMHSAHSSTNRSSRTSYRPDDEGPTFQGIDAGPILSGISPPFEVPPSYNPQWLPRTRIDSFSQPPRASPMSGRAFVEGLPLFSTNASSLDRATLTGANEHPDQAVVPSEDPPRSP
ncbi:hypothetical protein CspeluHIS016_0307000 [Cutaneotrichosporon spelunceum]|uniref:Uncharacterized protein n=1 Tax=Cutaneotrichosporon spelunceum TaxID=1672016 RepID=A0AAD3TUT7_9TREE|nr:hypothetical protein CspeluHIS016_0307000 [Cutaneotrichosporon spelunceum]